MIIGYTSGVFDIFHIGHEHFLQECKNQCDIFYVGVDSDQRVKMLKGAGRPIQPAKIRVKNVSKHCDYAFIKWESSSYYLQTIQPNIIFESALKQNSSLARCSKIKYVKIPYTETVSTTKLITQTPFRV